MKKPSDILPGAFEETPDFRALSAPGYYGPKESVPVPEGHLAWDVYIALRELWPGPTANWPDAPSTALAYALERMTHEQVSAGIRNMARYESEFPPSIPIIRKLCLTPDPDRPRGRDWMPLRYIETKEEKEKKCKDGLMEIRRIREEAGL